MFIIINFLNIILLSSVIFPLLKVIKNRLPGIILFFALYLFFLLIAFLVFYFHFLELPEKGILFSYGIGVVIIDFLIIALFLFFITKLKLANQSDIDKILDKSR